jgi:hypothetical protein
MSPQENKSFMEDEVRDRIEALAQCSERSIEVIWKTQLSDAVRRISRYGDPATCLS